MTLDSYQYSNPSEAVYYESFTLNVLNCETTAFTGKLADVVDTYVLYTPVRKYDYTAWGSTDINPGSCGYTTDYTAVVRNYYDTTLPLSSYGWVTWYGVGVTNGPSFWIQSDNTADVNSDR